MGENETTTMARACCGSIDSKKIQGEKSKLQVCALIYSLVNVLNLYIKNIFTLEIIHVDSDKWRPAGVICRY